MFPGGELGKLKDNTLTTSKIDVPSSILNKQGKISVSQEAASLLSHFPHLITAPGNVEGC